MPVHIYRSPDNGDGQLLVAHEVDDGTTVYRFDVEETDDETRVTFRTAIGVRREGDCPPEAVREGLEAAGYTISKRDVCTDGSSSGGDNSLREQIDHIREAVQAAKDANPEDRDNYIKAALGETQYLRARRDVYAVELQERLTDAVVAPNEEVPYFLNQALQEVKSIEERHSQSSPDVESDGAPLVGDELLGRVEEKIANVDLFESSEEFIQDAVELHLYKSFSDQKSAPDCAGERQASECSPEIAPLQEIARAQETLKSIPHARLDDDTSSRMVNALEQLDNILLDASGEDLLDARARAHEAPNTPGGESAETPDGVIKQRHAEADLCDTVPITIELTPAMVGLIDFVRDADQGESFTDWIKNTIRLPLARRDHQFWSSVTVPVKAELPPEAARWARLWANHYAATGSEPHDIETRMMDYIDLDFEWLVEGGEELDLPAEKDDGGDEDDD